MIHSKCTSLTHPIVNCTLLHHACFVSSCLCDPLICINPQTSFRSVPTYCPNDSRWNKSPKEFHAKTCPSQFLHQFRNHLQASREYPTYPTSHTIGRNASPIPLSLHSESSRLSVNSLLGRLFAAFIHILEQTVFPLPRKFIIWIFDATAESPHDPTNVPKELMHQSASSNLLSSEMHVSLSSPSQQTIQHTS
jgi:hypothetical protein